jgi:hypothetical protein
MMMWLCSACASLSTKEGNVLSKIPHKISWMREQTGMTELEAPEVNNHLIVFPGFIALKARITVIVLAKTVETATVKMSPNEICWSMKVAVLGWPMKSKEQRKHRRREMSRM